MIHKTFQRKRKAKQHKPLRKAGTRIRIGRDMVSKLEISLYDRLFTFSILLPFLFHLALSKFSEAIIDYCANKDNAPDKSVSKDRFEQEIGSAFDVLFNSWLQITKEMKVFILYENNSFFRERCFIMK